MVENIIFLIFRRMRAPLIALIATYSVTVGGLVLIPGQDAAGNPWHMDFFHAFYVISYTATTIGFGEIPYAFTDGQRLWVTLSIYVTVVVWVYSIGTLIALFQDRTFQQAMTELRFARRIRRLREPFYLVCGYGETGGALVRALTERNQHAVAIDIEEQRVNLLKLENLREYVPALCADARRPVHLLEAGLKHPQCSGVVALTNVNETNLKIAITAKLLHPEIKVICRADSLDVEANMASFGTNHIYDPFDTFAAYLATALKAPCLTLLHDWLSGLEGEALKEPFYPPARGLWILCGFGRFGKAVYKYFRELGIEVVVIEAQPERTGTPPEGCVVGRGTEAVTLEQADIHRAVGLVAGTDDDANNLSIILTALNLNEDLFVVARENHLDNEELFQALDAQKIVMHPSSVVANQIRVLLGTPLLSQFEHLARDQGDAWACELISRISGLVHDQVPEVWEIGVDCEQAHAVCELTGDGSPITLGEIMRDPRERERRLPCIALLLVRGNRREVLPAGEIRLREGDRLLFCGRTDARTRMEWTLQNLNALSYVLTGASRPQGAVWRWIAPLLERRQRNRKADAGS